jgi:hypothetical protein
MTVNPLRLWVRTLTVLYILEAFQNRFYGSGFMFVKPGFYGDPDGKLVSIRFYGSLSFMKQI